MNAVLDRLFGPGKPVVRKRELFGRYWFRYPGGHMWKWAIEIEWYQGPGIAFVNSDVETGEGYALGLDLQLGKKKRLSFYRSTW